jgi:hypothetical protein
MRELLKDELHPSTDLKANLPQSHEEQQDTAQDSVVEEPTQDDAHGHAARRGSRSVAPTRGPGATDHRLRRTARSSTSGAAAGTAATSRPCPTSGRARLSLCSAAAAPL